MRNELSQCDFQLSELTWLGFMPVLAGALFRKRPILYFTEALKMLWVPFSEKSTRRTFGEGANLQKKSGKFALKYERITFTTDTSRVLKCWYSTLWVLFSLY
jgi:hypothetical protein